MTDLTHPRSSSLTTVFIVASMKLADFNLPQYRPFDLILAILRSNLRRSDGDSVMAMEGKSTSLVAISVLAMEEKSSDGDSVAVRRRRTGRQMRRKRNGSEARRRGGGGVNADGGGIGVDIGDGT
ncbi:unnamed protein product [Cuscuta epithymum]|uniref:Uncharacterized protein n=1 Tax=Cuscuta epithymum TaxID=186058 RepID=A0AAV0CW52_9ASTE|nr:unnamed protein product [Cuscuta epithymum]